MGLARATFRACPAIVPIAITSARTPARTKGSGPRSMRASKLFSQSRITHQATGQAIRLAMITGLENCQASSLTMSCDLAPSTFRDWFVWLTLRFRRTARNKTTGQITVYGTDATTVVTTQTSTESDTAQTTGPTSS